jgi:hypothetical protein
VPCGFVDALVDVGPLGDLVRGLDLERVIPVIDVGACTCHASILGSVVVTA